MEQLSLFKPKPRILTLNLCTEYFNQIKAGTKTEEYRKVKKHWTDRIEGKEFDYVCICNAFPRTNDLENRLYFPWRGYDIKTINHPHFGPDPVRVYAIELKGD